MSGYSGAGTTPSDKNDPDKLRDNLIPYALTGHVHEAEATQHLGHSVQFMPHVAAHFRGLSITANLALDRAMGLDEVRRNYRSFYAGEPLIDVQDEAPWISAIAGRNSAIIGGFSLSEDGRRVVAVSDRKSTRLNSSHIQKSRMPSSA